MLFLHGFCEITAQKVCERNLVSVQSLYNKISRIFEHCDNEDIDEITEV